MGKRVNRRGDAGTRGRGEWKSHLIFRSPPTNPPLTPPKRGTGISPPEPKEDKENSKTLV
ncbi:MAG: hypothetical protein F6K41_39500 [Symploca sp. SIO3E6]|nr:hypothetical protein [Caldora sp. SIO3E6]